MYQLTFFYSFGHLNVFLNMLKIQLFTYKQSIVNDSEELPLKIDKLIPGYENCHCKFWVEVEPASMLTVVAYLLIEFNGKRQASTEQTISQRFNYKVINMEGTISATYKYEF